MAFSAFSEFSRARAWLRALVGRATFDRQLDDELRFHIEMRADDLAKTHGLSPEAALRRARLEFGSRDKFKEETRQVVGLRLADEVMADLRFAARTFRRQKMFAATAIVTLAIGIGANAVVFAALDALRLRKLPVDRPDELVVFESLRWPDSMVAAYNGQSQPGPNRSQRRYSFSALTFEAFRDRSTTLSNVFAIAGSPPLNVVIDGQADVARAALVSGDYFTGLGVKAAAGRLLEAADDRDNAEPVAVISHSYWQRQFGGRTDAVGSTIAINRVPFTIVGVTAESFHNSQAEGGPSISVPLSLRGRVSPTGLTYPVSAWWIEMMGRLKPGVTREQALAELTPMFADTVKASWDARPPTTRDGARTGMPQLVVNPGARGRHAQDTTPTDPLTLAFAIVGLMLLIGCANLATLLLARVAGRRDEVAMRLALGASRQRVVRQFLVESLFLALLGGAAGAVLAFWAKPLVVWLLDTTVDVRIDLRVIAFTTAVSACAAVLFGIAPALGATRGGEGQLLRLSAQKGGVLHGLIGHVLIGAQVALSLVLLVGSGLLARTLYNYSNVDLGFNVRRLLVFDVTAPPSSPLFARIAEAIEQVPGVEHATMTIVPLIARAEWSDDVRVAGGDQTLNSFLQVVHWNFFETIGLPVVAGRSLAATDVIGRPRAAVINESMARQLFGSRAPIGEHFHFVNGAERESLIEVVGIARDARYARLKDPAPPTMYFANAQIGPGSPLSPNRMTFEVRTAGDPLLMVPQVRAAVHSVDHDLPLVDVRTQEAQIADTVREPRAFALLAGAAAMVGVLLACIGLYGLVAHNVARRTVEIGIRMALGATRRNVVLLMVRQVLGMVAVGAIVGLVLSRAASRLIGEMLFDVGVGDPLTLAAAALFMAAVAALAAYLPARRAARLEPTQALRAQ